jgi:predicted lysophospholipase L1 biosynthesis ABC-type transport system permease subunit
MKDDIVGNVRPFLFVLLGAVGLLLLISCANVASLLLARATTRGREFAVRAALGASRARVISQLLTESILLAGLGGAVGLLLAFGATRTVLATLPGTLPRVDEVAVDSRVLLFTLGLSVAVGIIFGLAPALKATRANVQKVINEGGRGSSGVRHRLQDLFAIAQVTLALVLLIGAALMIRSLAALWRVNSGFNPRHAVTFNLSMPATPSTSAAETRTRLRQFDEAMRAIPGVRPFP